MGGEFYVNSFDVFSTIFDYEKCFMRPLELFKTSSADWLGSMFVPKTGVAHFTSLFSIEPRPYGLTCVLPSDWITSVNDLCGLNGAFVRVIKLDITKPTGALLWADILPVDWLPQNKFYCFMKELKPTIICFVYMGIPYPNELGIN